MLNVKKMHHFCNAMSQTWYAQAIGLVFTVIISGILCSGFVAEITENSKLVWANFYLSKCFWGIIIFVVLICVWLWLSHVKHKKQVAILNKKFCKDYIMRKTLPALAEVVKRDIKDGKGTEKLVNVMDMIDKIYKK